jgi:ferredoxin
LTIWDGRRESLRKQFVALAFFYRKTLNIMPYKVKVDRDLCIGAASCTAVSPNAFDLDSEGKAVIKKKDGTSTSDWVNGADIDAAQDEVVNAAKSCPVDAIIIVEVDDAGNEVRQIWPAK